MRLGVPPESRKHCRASALPQTRLDAQVSDLEYRKRDTYRPTPSAASASFEIMAEIMRPEDGHWQLSLLACCRVLATCVAWSEIA